MSLYQSINGARWRNIWVVGDLHGCHTLLMNELERVRFDPLCDLLISVGDLIDRGAENVECLELITMPWFKAVRGNHEQMMLDAIAAGYGRWELHWRQNGGTWYYFLNPEQEILAKSLIRKVAELPFIIEVEKDGKKFVICHADYPDDDYEFGKPVDADMVIWNRERVSAAQDGIVNEISGAELFIFGHTPAHQPSQYANQMYIDTGAVFCGRLTLVQIQGGAYA
ncbi:serine/threonine-protein phosphatase 1 [Klebsiella pneumoniae]|uniref:metallophosphoesterase n=1 Tax=Klebsiella pneumoniae TaxID=573 RepID=UPI000E2B9AB8|nr:metallophosphoesterase [Klebsiella pneumoniae]MBX4580731.1 serine/threonine protein phosphatase [Klebsiella pneumoniae]SVT79592.1 serine/threonine-protein phosphatase 1 [Klebsiella pneumoniae]SWL52194.1 serine/threonine-protein phosphatase 1 [Klebsiella pneumoniae]HBQ4060016.1 metallophosphoesterase [Klebsiella pneumoniae]HBR4237780.1 metallophosphoesterase [Klebsiella pneumoniae]